MVGLEPTILILILDRIKLIVYSFPIFLIYAKNGLRCGFGGGEFSYPKKKGNTKKRKLLDNP